MDARVVSSVDEALRYMLVGDETELTKLERLCAGKVRLGLAGRNGAKVAGAGHIYEFRRWQLPNDEETFVATKDGNTLTEHDIRQPVYRLVRHRAAEAMIAYRTGHLEYNQKRQERKKKKSRT